MKYLIITILLSLTAGLQAQESRDTFPTEWKKTVTIDTVTINFDLSVVNDERVIFTADSMIPVWDKRWWFWFSLCKNVWEKDRALLLIKKMENM